MVEIVNSIFCCRKVNISKCENFFYYNVEYDLMKKVDVL